MYLYQNLDPIALYYPWIDSNGYQNIVRFDQKFWKPIDNFPSTFSPAYSKLLSYKAN